MHIKTHLLYKSFETCWSALELYLGGLGEAEVLQHVVVRVVDLLDLL